MDFGRQTIEEAKEAFNDALNRDDYELAEEIYNQFPEINLIAELVTKGQAITNYLNEKDELLQQADSNSVNYEQQIQFRIDAVQKQYAKRLRILKNKQEGEMKEAFEKWRSQNADIDENSKQDYVQTITTARLVAGQSNFREAKRLRDTAFSNSNSTSMKSKAQISAKYQKIIESMSQRHKFELNQLIQKRDQEIRDLKYELNVSHQTAVDCFAIDNAGAITKNVQDVDEIMPLALIMQIQNTEIDNTNSKILNSSEKRFNEKMQTYQQVMSINGLKLNQKKRSTKAKSPYKEYSHSYKMSTPK